MSSGLLSSGRFGSGSFFNWIKRWVGRSRFFGRTSQKSIGFGNAGPILAPEIFCELAVPRYKKLTDLFRARGGYLPTLDHHVPRGVTFESYTYYMEQKRKVLGVA